MVCLILPLHPNLVHYPIALLMASAVTLLIGEWCALDGVRRWGAAARVAGLILALPAMVTGLLDKVTVPRGSPAENLANAHITATFAMWMLFIVSAQMEASWRGREDCPRRRWMWTGLLTAAIVALIIAGHLGARLVFELGVGVGR